MSALQAGRMPRYCTLDFIRCDRGHMHVCTPITDDIAERLFSVLLSSVYRKNSLTAMQLARCRPTIMSALQRCITRGSPIQITVLAFPFKVPNPAKVGARTLPDFAELAAIRQCLKLRAAIQCIYPPGLEYHILHDGPLIADVFGIETDEVRQYQTYFSKLVEMVAPDFIRCHDFGALQQQSALDPSGSIEELRFNAERWFRESRGTAEWKNAFRKTLGMINLREFPAKPVADLLRHGTVGRLPFGWEHIEHRVHTAMAQYHVADAIIHQFDPRPSCFPDAIHATTQERQGRLSLWMVRRGQSLLPWHGVGCLDERGRAQVVHAIRVRDRVDYQPLFVQGETTPFVYHKGNKSADLGLERLQ
jgi:Pyoverdine/dityrosine biosynthesis protein